MAFPGPEVRHGVGVGRAGPFGPEVRHGVGGWFLVAKKILVEGIVIQVSDYAMDLKTIRLSLTNHP